MGDMDTLVWVDPLGRETALTSAPNLDVLWLAGVEGRYMPPVILTEDQVPEQQGAQLRHVRLGPREVALPITVLGPDPLTVRRQLRALLSALNPLLGDGRLRATGPDGKQRELVCRYVKGWEGREGLNSSGRRFIKGLAVLRASRPYWQDVTPTLETYGTGALAFFPILPLRLRASVVTSTPLVVNDGDADAQPVWTIKGPGNGLTLNNTTTGRSLFLAHVWGAGEVVTIDTRTGAKTVRAADGTNLFSELSDDSELWELAPGANQLEVQLGEAVPESSVGLSYTRRYLTA